MTPTRLHRVSATTDHTSRATTRRRIATIAALTIALSLSPIPPVSSVVAQSPSSAVTGLAVGSQGDAVRDVQQALADHGVMPEGGIDGIFGTATEAALKQFQQRNGLAQSGKVDLATAIALGLEKSALHGLEAGTRSEAVTTLQKKLDAAGFSPGGIDGIFGAATESALKQFQNSKGFAQTGSVNAATAAALAGVKVGNGQASSSSGASTASSGGLAGLRIGSTGDAVKRVQRTIMDQGFTVVGGADGYYGVLTANAVQSFQNANSLEVSGSIDEATASLIERLSGGANTAASNDAGQHDPSVSSPYAGLQYGSIGADVKSLQEALINAGIELFGGADGVFGEHTVQAVKKFQGQRGLEQTGKVNAKTADALSSGTAGAAASNGSIVGLKAGALGNTVKQLQQAMIDAGIDVRGGADGIFGPATAEALRSFQTSQGLAASGEVDQATADALANPKTTAGSAVSGSGGSGYAVYGEKGDRVRALQQSLVNAGIAVRGGVDGDFGAGTSAAVMEFQRAQGLNPTGKVNDATASALGVSAIAAPPPPDASSVKLQVFPVQGPCYYGDSFGYTRGGGRLHLGVDIIGAEGLELYAVTDGRIGTMYHDRPGSLSGNGFRLVQPDGTYFFYAHLLDFAPGIEPGVPVKAGQVIGYLGNTGNSGTPHLHFEVHPKGGAAVNPYPIVKAIDAC